MVRTLVICSVAAALGLLASRWQSADQPRLQATVPDPLADTDGDLLPDAVEWVAVTSALRPDTDFDGVSDFLEVVQKHGSPRGPAPRLPQDHEMRVLLSSHTHANGARETWMHLLFRFMGSTSELTSFRLWIQIAQLPGVQIPLESLAFGAASIAQRVVPQEGLWVALSVPFVSENLLRQILPCTVVAESRIGGRSIRSGAAVFSTSTAVATLVPYEGGSYGTSEFAVQTLNCSSGANGGGSNKICVLELEIAGETVGGTVCRVRDAGCEDCNDLECGSGCQETIGWVFLLPGGVETIAGG